MKLTIPSASERGPLILPPRQQEAELWANARRWSLCSTCDIARRDAICDRGACVYVRVRVRFLSLFSLPYIFLNTMTHSSGCGKESSYLGTEAQSFYKCNVATGNGKCATATRCAQTPSGRCTGTVQLRHQVWGHTSHGARPIAKSVWNFRINHRRGLD